MPLDAHMGTRLRSERERLGLSQQKAADGVGVRREMWVKYEGGAEPGAGVLAAASRLGIDVLYVLSGQRQQAPSPAPSPQGAIDPQLMSRVIRFLNEQADQFGRVVPEPLKIEMAVRVYNYLVEELEQHLHGGDVQDRKIERIARLVVSN